MPYRCLLARVHYREPRRQGQGLGQVLVANSDVARIAVLHYLVKVKRQAGELAQAVGRDVVVARYSGAERHEVLKSHRPSRRGKGGDTRPS